MRANRRDVNHKELVGHARSLGFFVWDVADLKNCCDVVLLKSGHVFFCEIKDGNKPPSQKKLTEGELEFKKNIESHNGIHVIIEKKEDLNELFKNYNLWM